MCVAFDHDGAEEDGFIVYWSKRCKYPDESESDGYFDIGKNQGQHTWVSIKPGSSTASTGKAFNCQTIYMAIYARAQLMNLNIAVSFGPLLNQHNTIIPSAMIRLNKYLLAVRSTKRPTSSSKTRTEPDQDDDTGKDGADDDDPEDHCCSHPLPLEDYVPDISEMHITEKWINGKQVQFRSLNEFQAHLKENLEIFMKNGKSYKMLKEMLDSYKVRSQSIKWSSGQRSGDGGKGFRRRGDMLSKCHLDPQAK